MRGVGVQAGGAGAAHVDEQVVDEQRALRRDLEMRQRAQVDLAPRLAPAQRTAAQQGRGRVAANEYRVKWDLLRDAALRSRSEEALVRLVLPLSPEQPESSADDDARASVVLAVR